MSEQDFKAVEETVQSVGFSPEQLKYFEEKESVVKNLKGLGAVALDKQPYLKGSNGKTLEERKIIAERRLAEMPAGLKILIGRVEDYIQADDAHYNDGDLESLFMRGAKAMFPKYVVTGTDEVFARSDPYGKPTLARDMGDEPNQFNQRVYLVPLYVPIDLKAPQGVVEIMPRVAQVPQAR